MRKIAGLNEALYHRWVIAPSVEPEPRNRRSRSGVDVHYRLLAFVYVDFEEGISLWVEAPLVFDREGGYVRDLRRNQRSRAAPVALYLVPWTSMVPGQLRLASPEECARLGVGVSPAALSGFNTPDSVAAALAETRFDPYRARGYPRDVSAQIAVDGDAIGEQVWVRLLFPDVADPDSWQAMLLQVPETPGLGLAVGEVVFQKGRVIWRLMSTFWDRLEGWSVAICDHEASGCGWCFPRCEDDPSGCGGITFQPRSGECSSTLRTSCSPCGAESAVG